MNAFKSFFEERIWNVRLSDLPKALAARFQFCRVITLTVKFFMRNKCALHASALTYYTVLSIVPIAALIFGIAKGYGFEKILKTKIYEGFGHQTETANILIKFAENALEHASGGLVAGVGIVLLIWTALKLLSSIEASFNEIWGIRKNRTVVRKVNDYLTMLILCPVLLLVLTTSSAFIVARLHEFAENLPYTEFLNSTIVFMANLLPFLLACAAFTFIYLFIPNTKVGFKPAFYSGLFTGIFYIVLQFAYMYAMKFLTGYNAVYGSFAAIPFLLIWLQISWSLVLLGAQLSFALQNVNIYELAPLNTDTGSIEYRFTCAIRIMAELVKSFKEERGPVSLPELSSALEIPIRLTRFSLYELSSVGLTARLMTDEKVSELYQLAVPAEKVTPSFIMFKLASIGYQGYDTPLAGETKKLMSDLWAAAENAPANKLPDGGKGQTEHV